MVSSTIIICNLTVATGRGRRVFLKIVFRGPKAMEELAAYGPNLIVGIIGGGVEEDGSDRVARWAVARIKLPNALLR